jgi:N-acetyl-1-D-myo-inositol-2-amino-2-deoxy-alpha-D-glucopyranoside deacetylase
VFISMVRRCTPWRAPPRVISTAEHQSIMNDLLTRCRSILVLAPHPDDETLATGGLLGRLARSGCHVRIVFLTDGERNILARVASDRRLTLGPAARERFRQRRRNEATAALSRLAIAGECATFLGYPDSSLAALLRSSNPAPTLAIEAAIEAADPDLIVLPCRTDLHMDHRAAAVMTERAIHRSGFDGRVLHYAIHHLTSRASDAPIRFALSPLEVQRKRTAIEAYHSQLVLSRRRFMGFAADTEEFHGSCAGEATTPLGRILRPLYRVWTVARPAHPIGNH